MNEKYESELSDIRKKRRILYIIFAFTVVLAVVMENIEAFEIYIFITLVFSLFAANIFLVRVLLSGCPSCKKYYFGWGLWGNVTRNTCRHCGLKFK